MGSVETVTILITDLVGSTSLEARVGPGAADQLRDEHFTLIRAAVEETGGRETKNTGDGLIAAFHSASSAVACAVGVQQRFERRNRKSEEQLFIKVGLSLGDATAADGDYFGMPVIEAARLCDRASGGQILAKEVVAHLAAGRHGHSFKAVGALELKGIPEPLSTVEVQWEPFGEEARSLPLPARLQEMPPGSFAGRAVERERLADLFDHASKGNRRMALISGEPGIGKTRLSIHAALEARSADAVVLYGRCDEELAIPYRPWVEALSHYVEHAPEPVLRAHVERFGGELARLVPTLEDRLPDLPPPRETDPDTERYLLWGAVLGALGALCEEEPLVLVLDDLHWADKPTLLLLRHITSQGEDLRALIIATYRESDLARGHPLTDVLAALHREQGVERLMLTGLGEPDVVEIVEHAAGKELDQTVVELSKELLREADGNPFYTGELLRHLLESGALYQQDSGHWTVRGALHDLGLPQSVREVLGRRVERLGEDVHKALSLAAVIGREFDTDLLLRISEPAEEDMLDLLEQAVAASVLTESASVPGRFSFAHALINHTLYEELGTTRRARLHRRVAEALEELLGADPGPRVSELAYHWAKATPTPGNSKAISYARLAGERALAELAPDEAVRWLGQALALQGEGPVDQIERCDLLIELGDAQRQVGEAAYRETLLEASGIASALGDGDRAARAAIANNRGSVSALGDVDTERLHAVERALELNRDPALRAHLISLQTLELAFDPDHHRRRALADEALALARESGDVRTLANVLRGHIFALLGADTLDVRFADARELEETATRTGDPALQAWAAYCTSTVHAEKGDLRQADADGRVLDEITEELGEPILRWFSHYHHACLALLRGDLARAEQLAQQALEIGTAAGQPDAVMVYGSQIATIRSYQGRGQELIPLLEQGVEANPRITGWRAGLASNYCWLGRFGEAATIVEEAAKNGFADVPWDEVRSTTFALYAEAASQSGVTSAAGILYGLMEPWAGQVVWSGAHSFGYVTTYLGLLATTLGHDERADEHFAAACASQEKQGMLLWAARAHLGWAEALASRDETERASEEAARALVLAREHGYGAIAQRAEAVVEPESATRH
jgi:class 3 adenylate cyclase/tetratricopeptide (TPR) repeat protein